MIELAFLVLVVMVMVVPTVLYQTLGDQLEKPFFVLAEVPQPGGPYRGEVTLQRVPFVLPGVARGAVALSFLFAVLGLLMAMPTLLGVLCQWGVALLIGLPGLGLAMAATAVGIQVLRSGPGTRHSVTGVGLGQTAFGLWLLATVVTVTDAQHGPVAGLVETTVARTLQLLGGSLRDSGWSLALSVDGGLGLLPVLYATACVVHGLLLLSTARTFASTRSVSSSSAPPRAHGE